jgi:predicted RNA methylase
LNNICFLVIIGWMNSKKIHLDKYYTSSKLAEYVVAKVKEILGENNITEYLEPSAGNGVFLNYLPENVLAYDIDPEDARITKQDFLKLELEYKEGRCVVGNPPYGTRNTLSVSFFKKSIKLCDFIAFILPISQYKNSQQMYEFDLIYSEDLGKRKYSDRHLHCCLNIYKRNKGGLHKRPPNYKLKDVEILEYRRNGSYIKPEQYDFGMCSWGSGIGKEVRYVGEYAQ